MQVTKKYNTRYQLGDSCYWMNMAENIGGGGAIIYSPPPIYGIVVNSFSSTCKLHKRDTQYQLAHGWLVLSDEYTLWLKILEGYIIISCQQLLQYQCDIIM